jgi:riboflavin biosynthesis pyrimidine reductase
LDGRTSSHEIVEMLDLGEDGRRLVQDLRRTFDSSPSDEALLEGDVPSLTCTDSPSEAVVVPMWPVLDRTLWVPRYDLYVARSLRTPALTKREAY